MSDPVQRYCNAFFAAPFVELRKLSDVNPSWRSFALQVLERLGWRETDLATDLTSLYALSPKEILESEMLLAAPTDAVMAHVLLALQTLDSQSLKLPPPAEKLLLRQKLLTPNKQRLTKAGRQLLEARELAVAASYRDLLRQVATSSILGEAQRLVLAAAIGLERDFLIRYANAQDLPRLVELEALCWQHTRTSEQRLRARVQDYPQGQFVLEKDGRVLAAVYSQRIVDVEAIDGRDASNIHELHDPSGSTVQLLALNVDPAAQNQALGDQLLEFVLQCCERLPDVNRVVGVTLCKHYESGDFGDYIRLQGAEQDPVLAFHQSHGARIVKPIAHYRPEDAVNQHNGVLVSYDIKNRVRPKENSAGMESFLERVARQLGERADAIDPDRPLMELGLDSADLLKLQLQVEAQYERTLRPAFFFEFNTVNKVNAYLAGDAASGESKVDTPAPAMSADIAIIGMACKLPGGIESPEQLWQLLVSEGSAIGAYPRERGAWPISAAMPGIDRGGFMREVEAFDSAFFRIAPKEAQIIDPQQRILLELAWACFEDAAVLPASLKGTRTGVFVGASNADYGRLIQDAKLETEAHHATGNSLAVLANRLSYFFDLSGPSLLIDTACSASLVALHTAIQSLHANECATALVGGVNLICHPDLSVAYYKAGMLAADGRCKVFDAKANGYVRSEGAVMLLLKPLRAALADQDRIHAVIKGSAINHGGLAGGLTVPNPQKQSELLEAAWKSAGITAQELSYLEAHGTGTSLGDPIEVQGIQTAVAQSGARCMIGSVKSNLGHLESAAGLAGLLKVVLSLQYRQIPASIHFQQLNPKILLEDESLAIATRLTPWESKGPRTAGVSSFGSGGANAHVVVQEYTGAAPPAAKQERYVFTLSAAHPDRLREYVKRVMAWLDEHALDDDFADAIATWMWGRSVMKHRLSLEVTDRIDLREQLSAWLAGDGVAIAAESDVSQRKPFRRISVPTYPFARERYWIDVAKPLFFEEHWQEQALPSTASVNPEAIFFTDAKGQGEAGIHALFAFFKQLKESTSGPRHVVLVGQYDPASIESCWDYAWIGFERSLRMVLPETRITLLYTDSGSPTEPQLADASRHAGVIWYQGDRRFVLASRAVTVAPQASHLILKKSGGYLITGGAGALGFLFARDLAEKYQAKLLLVGRRPLSATIQAQLDKLREAGAAEAHYHSLDLSDRNAVVAWSQQLPFNLSGVIHAAGVQSIRPFYEKSTQEINEVLRPKTLGTVLLDEALSSEPLDFTCYFSSSAAMLGDFGACDYAVANRFLMAYGQYRNALVINWPLWKEGGMELGDAEQTAFYLKSSGQERLESQTGLAIWRDLLRTDRLQTLVMVGDAVRVEQLLGRFYPSQPKESVSGEIRELVARSLKIPQSELDDQKNLADYGFDSIHLTGFAKQLTAHFGIEVTPALFFSYTTIRQLSDYFTGQRGVTPRAVTPVARASEPIAVIGMSGRFPGAATVDEFWSLLASGQSAIREVPLARWDWRDYSQITTNQGGFIDGVEEFDPLFFEISPREAEEMDPGERLLLMEAYKAIENAGLAPSSLSGGKVGVFVGAEESQYDAITGRQGITTSGNAMVSSRLSYFLDLRGPAIATNTACSSSLVALHQAVMSLRQGECHTALVAGISLSLSPAGYLMMSEAGMLSRDGQCFSFAKKANGIGVGEAVVVLLLKPLSAALAAGDPIYGTIKASGINFDGKTNGVTAPSGKMQAELIESVYTENQVNAANISHIVTHGTGTALGDPVEIQALSTVFQGSAAPGSCAITSCKSNVGHTLAASGLVSVVSLLKGLQHRQIPPTLHCEPESDYIDWRNSPFYLNKALRDWTGSPVGAVSSFGRSGTNAHVVIEGHAARVTTSVADSGNVIVPLSARSAGQLRQKALELRAWILANPQVELSSVAYTLQVGRDAMRERTGFVVKTVSELAEKLAGDLKADRHELLSAWVNGSDVDWNVLYAEVLPQRIALPTYPFAKDRYWLKSEAAPGATLHPLLHRNTSNLSSQTYTSTFTGNEFFLRDHEVLGQKILPGVAYLEMARAALMEAVPAHRQSGVLELRHTVWIKPFICGADRSITIALTEEADRIRYEIYSEDAVHCQGEAVFSRAPVPEKLDVAALKAQMSSSDPLLAAEIYAAYGGIGLHYGPAFQGIQQIFRGENQLLAQLRAPAAKADYFLHPSLMDAALQSAIGFHRPTQPPLPFELSGLSIFAPCESEMFAWVREGGKEIDLCARDGTVCAQLRGFHARAPEVKAELLSLAPVWNPVFERMDSLSESAVIRVWGPLDWVRKSYPHAMQAGESDHLLWIAPEDSAESIIAQQEAGVLAVFRIAKSLLNSGWAEKELHWTLITRNTSTHAGIAGLIGSLAKEYPHWKLRLLEVESLESLSLKECFSLPCETLAQRNGEWFRQELARVSEHVPAEPVYKHKGVYVVVGGAGGLGEVWSRELVERYQAQIVWIGRRALDGRIQEKIRALGQSGPPPLYISADATRLESLEQAFKTIQKTYPVINGVVHSALVLRDQSVLAMDESTFREGLSSKVDISVNLDKVFGDLKLDFMLFFSSMMSFLKAPGQCNYAAGCTFKDAFAQSLQKKRPYPVKIMNWGYWGEVGVVSSDFYSKRMAQAGIGSIEPPEGLRAVEALLGGDANQMVFFKSLDRGTAGLNITETLTRLPKAAPALLPDVRETKTAGLVLEALDTTALEATLSAIDYAVVPPYSRWLASCQEYLRARQTQNPDQAFSEQPLDAGRARLLDVCLRALPEILRGEKLATDVMFPNGSMHLVEAVYKGNASSDYYNAVLGQALAQYLHANRGRKVRLLEIGAGTGGTTTALLPILQEHAQSIAEYCYTDVSKAFLIHAEEHYQPLFPALTTAILDVSKPLSGPLGQYDVIIATNVLHATPDIRRSLRNAKGLLKHQGLLLLNELSTATWFNHLTFGLLSGWWLHQDAALRLPGSPVLTPEKWAQVLTEEGFESIRYPAEVAHSFGQQVITAVSDGVVRQPIGAAAPIVEVPAALSVAVTGDSLREKSISYFQGLIAKTLKMSAHQLDPTERFEKFGLDSILIVKLTSEIRAVLPGITSTLFFEVQSVEGLVDHLLEERQDALETLVAQSARSNAVATAAAPSNRSDETISVPSGALFDVAIVGCSGRYPQSENMERFWENLASGVNCITEIPQDRWSWQEYFDAEKGRAGKIYTKFGGFLTDIDKFDPLFFKLSPKEAKTMDPQERLFLEASYHAIEDAGYTPDTLGDSEKIGVFVGVMNSRYNTQPLYYSVANRVSYLFNFQGPSMAVDTACSSSLTAIHLALESLYSGLAECAIAGGVNLVIDPVHFQELSALTMLSAGKECKSFGASADGFVDAEGVGAVVLKPLKKAEADGDHIYGVIKGSAINAGGKTNGYTVPNPKAQAQVVAKALERAGVKASEVTYIEAHGTGTALGDPIEIAGLTRAFRQTSTAKQFCAIGSLKSNIGHCESAAGIAGLTKVLLQLKHRKLVPSLHAAVTNPEIDFSATPFKVQRALEDWNAPTRIAGISSFGAGGSNAHVIVQEYVPPPAGPAAASPVATRPKVIIPLSARTRDQLQRKTQDLLERLRKLEPLDLQALAYTLQVGREAMDERVAFVVESLDAPSFKNAFHGQAKRGRETGTVVTDYTDLSKVAEAWVNGAKVDWARLYGASRPKRISLPTYPFARERYWRERADAAQSVLHPLVQQNVSGIHQQCYRSTFSGGELFLTEQRTLPAMAFLEMARVAVESAANAKGRALELFNIVWADAVTIKDRTPIEIALFANGPDELAYEIYSPTHDVVHFQGHAFLGRKLAPEKVDTRNLKPLALGAAPDGYVLPPHLLAATGHAQLPLALESLRILRPCSQHMFFWSRSSAGERSQLDIDVCDGDGNVCIQLRGVTFESEGVALTEPRSAAFTARASSKPTGISLA